MLLALFLLNFECKTRSEDSGREGKEGNGEDAEARGDDLPHPGARNSVTISYRCYCYLKIPFIFSYFGVLYDTQSTDDK